VGSWDEFAFAFAFGVWAFGVWRLGVGALGRLEFGVSDFWTLKSLVWSLEFGVFDF